MSPPLRDAANQEALWRGLAGGDLQVVATDHCPFTLADKARAGTTSRRSRTARPASRRG